MAITNAIMRDDDDQDRAPEIDKDCFQVVHQHRRISREYRNSELMKIEAKLFKLIPVTTPYKTLIADPTFQG